MPGTTRSRSYVGTYNNHVDRYDALIQRIREEENVLFFCAQGEIGEQGTPHLQFMVEFRNARAISALTRPGRLLEGCYLEPRRGTVAEAIEYCSKDETHSADVYGRIQIGNRDAVIGLGQGRGK